MTSNNLQSMPNVTKTKNSQTKAQSVVDADRIPGPWSTNYVPTNRLMAMNCSSNNGSGPQICSIMSSSVTQSPVVEVASDNRNQRVISSSYLQQTNVVEPINKIVTTNANSINETKPRIVNLNTNSDVHALIKEATADKSDGSVVTNNKNQGSVVIPTMNKISSSEGLTSAKYMPKRTNQDVNEKSDFTSLPVIKPFNSRTMKMNIITTAVNSAVATNMSHTIPQSQTVEVVSTSSSSTAKSTTPSVTLTYIPSAPEVNTPEGVKARVLTMNKENVRLIKETNSLSAICSTYGDEIDDDVPTSSKITTDSVPIDYEANTCSDNVLNVSKDYFDDHIEVGEYITNHKQENVDSASSQVKDKRNFSTHNDSEHQGTSFQDVQDDTECLTILSSDEEESVNTKHQVADTTVIEKEPIITDIRSSVYDEAEDGADSEDTEFDVCGYDSINLSCRTVRIGSYKAIPRQDIIFSQRGVKIWVPQIRNHYDSVLIKIPLRCIVKLLFHFGRSLPVIFIYTMPQIATNIRKLLRMNESNGHYFNPASRNEVFKRITLLPERVTEAMQNTLQDLFEGTDDLLQELTVKEANDILVRSSPAEVQNLVKHANPGPTGPTGPIGPSGPIQTIMVYPPAPAKGGISINTEDYACLSEDVFLNDVIIDFYLKYLMNKYVSEEDRSKIHIFSSFFYKRLTDKATPISRQSRNKDPSLTPADIRHSRVKNWTKNIDLFSKEHIIIPINENSHWFLAIVCYPGLEGPVRMDDGVPVSPVPTKMRPKPSPGGISEDELGKNSDFTIGSTTITPIKSSGGTVQLEDEDEEEERDEADGKDEDVDYYYSSENEDSSATVVNDNNRYELRDLEDKDPIKQPCILVFDSLAGASRARIIATLRDYLRIEYRIKNNGKDRDFSKAVFKGDCPKVPQQDNFTDCGLFLLQYVETFLKSKIQNYRVPVTCLRNWFNPQLVNRKRFDIQQLIHDLMREQGIDVTRINLPSLKFKETGANSECYDSEDDYSEGDFDEDYMNEEDELYYEDDGTIEQGEYDDDDNEVVEEEEDDANDDDVDDDYDEDGDGVMDTHRAKKRERDRSREAGGGGSKEEADVAVEMLQGAMMRRRKSYTDDDDEQYGGSSDDVYCVGGNSRRTTTSGEEEDEEEDDHHRLSGGDTTTVEAAAASHHQLDDEEYNSSDLEDESSSDSETMLAAAAISRNSNVSSRSTISGSCSKISSSSSNNNNGSQTLASTTYQRSVHYPAGLSTSSSSSCGAVNIVAGGAASRNTYKEATAAVVDNEGSKDDTSAGYSHYNFYYDDEDPLIEGDEEERLRENSDGYNTDALYDDLDEDTSPPVQKKFKANER